MPFTKLRWSTRNATTRGTDPAGAVAAIDATNLWGVNFREYCTY